MALNLNRLNHPQKEAVLHGNGPLLVLAGAGSGKTSTMTYRIAHLVSERHVPGSAVLGLSFTNKAAGELKERVKKLISQVAGPRASQGLTISTFHSLCVRILREHAQVLGFQNDFTIVDTNDQRDILKTILRNVRIDDRKFDLDTLLFALGQAKSRFLKPDEAESFFLESKTLGQDYALAAASCFGKYRDQLKLQNLMDFDDLLYNAVDLLESSQEVRYHYNCRFRHILVDEYQDTNASQFRLLRLLTESQQNICVVGDDDQSIYGWRGADSAHILSFPQQFPGARVITLDQNYRSVSTILDAANQVIKGNTQRYQKTLWSDRGEGEPILEVVLENDREEAEYVAEDLLERQKTSARPWKDFAVLYRSNVQSRVFEEAFRRLKIPYKIVGGMSFLDRKEVKDVLAYWKLIGNPKDDASLRRVINVPSRGIGKTTLEKIGTHAFAQNLPVFDVLGDAAALGVRGAENCLAFRTMILQLREELEASPATPEMVSHWARRSLEKAGIKKAIEEEEDDPIAFAKRWEIVEELCHSIGQLDSDPEVNTPMSILQDFLARMVLEAQELEENAKDQEKKKDRDQLTLLTLHGAKGLEYPVVYLVGMEEGFLPHQRTIDEAADFSEERRLCYVGITRARDHLILTRSKNRIRYGKPVPRYPSRFLADIPQANRVLRDESFSPDLTSVEAKEQHEEKVKNFLADIRSKLQQK